MTFDAWRSAVGGQWQRLLVYPGGLAAIGLVALGWGLWRLLVGAAPDRSTAFGGTGPFAALALAGPCVVLALLPAPQASELRSPIDLPTAWLLLDLPLLAAIASCWSGTRSPAPARPAALAALGVLVAAPLLALLLAAWGAVTRSWTVASLAQGNVPPWFRHAFCAIWLIALVPGLGLGPWHIAGGGWSSSAGLALRRLGHLLLLTLALLPLWPPSDSAAQGWWAAARRDGRLPALLTLGGCWLALLAIQRAGRGRSPLIWGRAVWGGGLLGLAGLVALAFQGWPG